MPAREHTWEGTMNRDMHHYERQGQGIASGEGKLGAKVWKAKRLIAVVALKEAGPKGPGLGQGWKDQGGCAISLDRQGDSSLALQVATPNQEAGPVGRGLLLTWGARLPVS